MTTMRRLRPLPPREKFVRHVARNVTCGLGIAAGSLLLGSLGYHFFEHEAWIDALLDATMILTGMGPLTHPQTDAGKLFSTAFALYSWAVFILTGAIVLTPVVHRFLHRLHLDMTEE